MGRDGRSGDHQGGLPEGQRKRGGSEPNPAAAAAPELEPSCGVRSGTLLRASRPITPRSGVMDRAWTNSQCPRGPWGPGGSARSTGALVAQGRAPAALQHAFLSAAVFCSGFGVSTIIKYRQRVRLVHSALKRSGSSRAMVSKRSLSRKGSWMTLLSMYIVGTVFCCPFWRATSSRPWRGCFRCASGQNHQANPLSIFDDRRKCAE